MVSNHWTVRPNEQHSRQAQPPSLHVACCALFKIFSEDFKQISLNFLGIVWIQSGDPVEVKLLITVVQRLQRFPGVADMPSHEIFLLFGQAARQLVHKII